MQWITCWAPDQKVDGSRLMYAKKKNQFIGKGKKFDV